MVFLVNEENRRLWYNDVNKRVKKRTLKHAQIIYCKITLIKRKKNKEKEMINLLEKFKN